MPQFDFYSFITQTFWVLLSFTFFYFFIVYFYLSSFSETLKFRQKLLTDFVSNKSVGSKEVYDLYIKKFFDIVKQ